MIWEKWTGNHAMSDPDIRSLRFRSIGRAFLAAAAGAMVLAVLAGCPTRTPAPTPTPTRTPRGLAATATPVPLPTEVASFTSYLPPPTPGEAPTETPAPTLAAPATPTASPEPTATPTPPPTPFPPGPPSKLGLFVSRNDPRIFDLLRTGNVAVVKTLEYDPNFVAEIKQVSPNTVVVARLDLPQIDLGTLTDPEGAARAFADKLLPIATEPRRLAAIDAWEAYNEPVPTDGEQMARLARFEAERTRLLAAAGVRSVIGNFGTGQPDLALWPQFRPALEAARQHKGYLGLHEYSAPTLQFGTPQDPLGWGTDPAQSGWLTLRYRKVYREYLEPNGLALPLILTEIGIDGLVGNRSGPDGEGWQDFGGYWADLGMGKDSPGNYMEQLAWYDASLQQDDYVVGGAIYAAAASQGWQSYEILGENSVEPFLQQYLSVHPER
jgi:hypothetical protein